MLHGVYPDEGRALHDNILVISTERRNLKENIFGSDASLHSA